MTVTGRFDIQTFLETCYGFEKRREVVCTKIEALGYYGKNPVLQKNVRCTSCTDYVNETFLVGQPLGENTNALFVLLTGMRIYTIRITIPIIVETRVVVNPTLKKSQNPT